jgi:hypothetical protein
MDIATQAQVSGGLSITATPTNGRGKTVPAFVTRSGIYAFQGLPGLHDFEYGIGQTFQTSPPASPPGQEFAIRVEDALGNYLPWSMALTLPRSEVLTTWLFSAPKRAGVPGFMVIRGGLKDTTRRRADGTLRPAAFARISAEYEVTSPPTAYVALADWRGEFALFLPAPNPLQRPAGETVTSPNTTGRKTISQLRWPVTLSFFYQPEKQRFICADARAQIKIIEGQQEGLTDNAPTAASERRCVPELVSLLMQGAAEMLPGVTLPAAAALEAEIEFGKDVVVRTDGSTDSCVWLVPPTIVSP